MVSAAQVLLIADIVWVALDSPDNRSNGGFPPECILKTVDCLNFVTWIEAEVPFIVL